MQSKLEKNYQQATESANDKRIRETQKSYKMMNDIEQKKQASSSSNSSSESSSAKSQSSSNTSGSSNNTKQIVLTKVEGKNTPQKEDHSKDKLTLYYVFVTTEDTRRTVPDKNELTGSKLVGETFAVPNVYSTIITLSGEAWQFKDPEGTMRLGPLNQPLIYCNDGKTLINLQAKVQDMYLIGYHQRKNNNEIGSLPEGVWAHIFSTKLEASSFIDKLKNDFASRNYKSTDLRLIQASFSLSNCN